MKLVSSIGAAALALLALTGAASAQVPEVRSFNDFTVRCLPVRSASPCEMVQERGNPQTGQRTVTMIISFAPSANQNIMMISVPLGVSIERGVVIETSALTTQPMQLRFCDRNGCFVQAFAPQTLIDSFKKASAVGKVKVVGDDDKPYEFDLSFAGFEAAYDYMVAQNRAKATTTPSAGAPAPQ